MALKLTQDLTGVVIGALSGATNGGFITPLSFGPAATPTKVQYSTVVEAVAAVGGMAMQLWAPMSMSNIVDGAVVAGLALLSKRGVENMMSTPTKPAIAPFATQGQLGAGQMNAMVASNYGARVAAQLGTTSGLRRSVIS